MTGAEDGSAGSGHEKLLLKIKKKEVFQRKQIILVLYKFLKCPSFAENNKKQTSVDQSALGGSTYDSMSPRMIQAHKLLL